jgi:hypothetical protein
MNRRLETRSSVIGGAVEITVAYSDGVTESMTLAVERGGVHVEIGRGATASVAVDSLQLVRLLFGLDVPSRWCPWLDRKAAELLDQVLPLDVYVFKLGSSTISVDPVLARARSLMNTPLQRTDPA